MKRLFISLVVSQITQILVFTLSQVVARCKVGRGDKRKVRSGGRLNTTLLQGGLTMKSKINKLGSKLVKIGTLMLFSASDAEQSAAAVAAAESVYQSLLARHMTLFPTVNQARNVEVRYGNKQSD